MPNNLHLIDPRQQAIDKTTSNLYIPAMKELEWEPPLYVLLYNQIRYYEDYGKLKCGYSVASKEVLAEQFGVTVQQIEQAYNTITNIKHLGNWQICDKRIFRNVKKVWVSNVRQARGTMEEMAEMLENSDKIRAKLLQNQSKTLTESELASLGDPCPKVIESNINMSSSANADSDVIKEDLEFPFDEDVDEVSEANVVNLKKVADEKNKSTRRAAAVAGEVAGILGRDRRQVTPAVVKNMKSVLEDYTRDEVIQMAEWCKTQEFWQDKTLLQMIKKDTVAQALMTKKRSKYDW